MAFKTRGMVTGHNRTGDRFVTARGDLFTQVSATNQERGGTLVKAQVKADGSGWFELRIEGKQVRVLSWDGAGNMVSDD